MSEQRCECCDLPVSSCGKAAEKRQRAEIAAERKRMLAHPATFGAIYLGTCGGCGESFPVGEPIARHPEKGWIAGACLTEWIGGA